MIKRRSLLNVILFAPAIIPSTSLMSLSWHSSKLLLTPPKRRLSANWTIEYGDVDSMIDPDAVDEIALVLRQEIERAFAHQPDFLRRVEFDLAVSRGVTAARDWLQSC